MNYKGEYRREISFPIGGIGTGCFGISGNGSFIDWEIFNRPAKGSILEYSHIAVRARTKDKTIVKVLCGDTLKDLTGTYDKSRFHGFGFGPRTGSMAGLSHFESVVFDGSFPIARLTFSDDGFPGEVVMTAFNPFIPLDSENSSLPAGFFKIEFHNPTCEGIEYSAVFSMANPFEEAISIDASDSGVRILKLFADMDTEDKKYGDISILTDCPDSALQQYWYRGSWLDSIDVFWNELNSRNRLDKRVYGEKRNGKQDIGSVAAYVNIGGGGSEAVKFVLSWNVPNNYAYWKNDSDRSWKNYYATVWDSSVDSGKYCMENFDLLLDRTEEFRKAINASTLDETVIDAVTSNLSVLRSPTVLRLEDGSFYGWEGVHELAGSCEGTCQHVWNYAYALCFLFPDLERSIRENELKYCTDADGKTTFRMMLPRDSEKWGHRACLDGQMGTVIKIYREWRISGDSTWLRSIWNTVKNILSYAWSENNPDRWDRDCDGVLEGRQHHTLDMELFGPSAWLEGMYLAALRAATEMASYLGDSEALTKYTELYNKGYEYTKEHLFNGEYFIQNIDLNDKSISDFYECSEGNNGYWYEESGELKYQIGEGCEIDQLLGQWHANICGLGDVFDKEQKKKALESLFKYNFKPKMRDFSNTWRVYSADDEGGAVMCTFPHGKPVIPLPYHSETMTGFEYALASLMISEGFEEEGLTIIRAVRDRYDGKKRNPWNEIECGSNYARSMASFSLLPVYSGLIFDLPNKKIGFAPIKDGYFKCFFSVGTAWGITKKSDMGISVEIKEGYLDLCCFEASDSALRVCLDGVEVDFETKGKTVIFENTVIKKSLVVEYEK